MHAAGLAGTDRAAIRTARLLLRPIGAEDVEGLVHFLSDPAIAYWLSFVPRAFGPEEAHAIITDFHRSGALVWAIERDGRLLGHIGIGDELGYWLAPDAWGEGIATEAARAAIARHFEIGRGRIRAGVDPENHRSARVLERLGFERTAVEWTWFASREKACRRILMDLEPARWPRVTLAAQ
ncbi:MAG: N-acetyltransferase [Rhodobacteraceae bacterium]|nr:MAG: N-acetyltransferase [Paracoccaceae bacterium]